MGTINSVSVPGLMNRGKRQLDTQCYEHRAHRPVEPMPHPRKAGADALHHRNKRNFSNCKNIEKQQN